MAAGATGVSFGPGGDSEVCCPFPSISKREAGRGLRRACPFPSNSAKVFGGPPKSLAGHQLGSGQAACPIEKAAPENCGQIVLGNLSLPLTLSHEL